MTYLTQIECGLDWNASDEHQRYSQVPVQPAWHSATIKKFSSAKIAPYYFLFKKST